MQRQAGAIYAKLLPRWKRVHKRAGDRLTEPPISHPDPNERAATMHSDDTHDARQGSGDGCGEETL